MTGGILPSKRRTIWERDVACHYCRSVPPVEERTADHVWPKALGGADANWNLVAACASCNESLGHLTDKCACKFCINAWRQHNSSGLPTATTHHAVSTVASLAGFALVNGEWTASPP